MLPGPHHHGESLAAIRRIGTPCRKLLLLQDGSPEAAFSIEAALIEEVVFPLHVPGDPPPRAAGAPLQGTPALAFAPLWDDAIRVAFSSTLASPSSLQHQGTTCQVPGAGSRLGRDNVVNAERVQVRVLLAAHRLCKAARRFSVARATSAEISGEDGPTASLLGSRDKQSVRILLGAIGDLIVEEIKEHGREPEAGGVVEESFTGHAPTQQARTDEDDCFSGGFDAEKAIRSIRWCELAGHLRQFADYWFENAFFRVLRSIFPAANQRIRSQPPSFLVLWAVMSCAMDAIKWLRLEAETKPIRAEAPPFVLLNAIKHALARVAPLLSPDQEVTPASSACLVPAARKTVQVLLALIQGEPALPLSFDDWKSFGGLLAQVSAWANTGRGNVNDSTLGASFSRIRSRLDAERYFQITALADSGGYGSASHEITDDPEWMARYLVALLAWLALGIETEFDRKDCAVVLDGHHHPAVWAQPSAYLLHVDAADAVRVCAVNDAHLIAVLAAHLRLWTAQRPSVLLEAVGDGGVFTDDDASPSITVMSPAHLFGMVADDVFLGDASVAVDWALESPAFLAYVLRLARWLLLRAKDTIESDMSGESEDHRVSCGARADVQIAVELRPAGIDVLRQLLRSAPALPFPTRTLEATLMRVLTILGQADAVHRQSEETSDNSDEDDFERRLVKRIRMA